MSTLLGHADRLIDGAEHDVQVARRYAATSCSVSSVNQMEQFNPAFRSIEDCLLDLHIQEVQKIERPPVPAGSAWSSHLNPSTNLLRLLCLHRSKQNLKSPVSN